MLRKTLALGGKIPTGAGRSPWKAKSNTTTPKVNCLLGTLPKRLQGNGTEGRSHSIHSMHVFNSWASYQVYRAGLGKPSNSPSRGGQGPTKRRGHSSADTPDYTRAPSLTVPQNFLITSTSPYVGRPSRATPALTLFACISPPEWVSPLKARAGTCTLPCLFQFVSVKISKNLAFSVQEEGLVSLSSNCIFIARAVCISIFGSSEVAENIKYGQWTSQRE